MSKHDPRFTSALFGLLETGSRFSGYDGMKFGDFNWTGDELSVTWTEPKTGKTHQAHLSNLYKFMLKRIEAYALGKHGIVNEYTTYVYKCNSTHR